MFFVDLRAAFDSMDRGTLIRTMRERGGEGRVGREVRRYTEGNEE